MGNEAGSSGNPVGEIEAALRSMEAFASKSESPGKPSARKKGRSKARSPRRILPSIVKWTFGLAIGAVLPLLVLVRLSVWLYSSQNLWPWLSVIAGAVAAAVILIVVTLLVIRAATGRFRSPVYLKRVTLGIALAFCVYSGLYVSASNVKSEAIRSTYTSLHPSLRVALSTWMLFDSRIVITDAARTVEDYARMGLRRNEGSLHLVRSTGYVHAVDLRTIGRPEWRNVVTTMYFKLLGFRSRRHVGTADHLHISLPVAR